MADERVYKITNYLREDDFKDAYVSVGTSSVEVARTAAYLSARMTRWSDDNMSLSNQDIADMLVRFYGFAHADASVEAKEVDVEMELKLYHLMGRALPECGELLADPTLAANGIEAYFERLTQEAFVAD